MSEKEKEIIETFINLLPKLTELEREKLLSFGQGMTFMKDEQAKKTAAG